MFSGGSPTGESVLEHQPRWTYLFSGPLALVACYLLNGALNLKQINALVAELHTAVREDGLDFGKLVGVAGDEVQFLGCHAEWIFPAFSAIPLISSCWSEARDLNMWREAPL